MIRRANLSNDSAGRSRNRKIKPGALAENTFGPHLATHIFYQMLYDSQTQAASARSPTSGFIHSVKPFKNTGNILTGNSIALVLNHYLNMIRIVPTTTVTSLFQRSVLDGIIVKFSITWSIESSQLQRTSAA